MTNETVYSYKTRHSEVYFSVPMWYGNQRTFLFIMKIFQFLTIWGILLVRSLVCVVRWREEEFMVMVVGPHFSTSSLNKFSRVTPSFNRELSPVDVAERCVIERSNISRVLQDQEPKLQKLIGFNAWWDNKKPRPPRVIPPRGSTLKRALHDIRRR
jgi:hypothetical protein